MAEESLATKQHPVPQQVFGVQFRLVGNLTIRQFVILAVCGFFAYVFFVSGLFIVLRIFLSGAFLLGGVAFAFVPIQDQPMDQWITAFLRAVYSPTRRIWEKDKKPVEFLTLEIPKIVQTEEPGLSPEESRRRLETYLKTLHEERELGPLDLAEQQYLASINTIAHKMVTHEAPLPTPKPIEAAPSPTLTLEEVLAHPPVPSPEEAETPHPKFVEAEKNPSLASAVNFSEPLYKVQRGRVASYFAARRNVRVGRRLTPLAIAGAMVYAPAHEQIIAPTLPPTPIVEEIPYGNPLPQAPQVTPVPTPIALPPEPIVPAPQPVSIPTAPPPEPQPISTPKPTAPLALPPIPTPTSTPKPTVQSLPKPSTKKVAPPKEGTNIIAGTALDPSGGLLAQTLIVIKDQKGNVVRATKTNELGKFFVSPLPNGFYGVEVQKTPFSFATMKVELTGLGLEELELKAKE